MPSPIAHSAIGYLGYRIFRGRVGEPATARAGLAAPLLAGTVFLSLLPDLDWIMSLATGDPGRFHNNVTHSLVVGVLVAAIAGSVVSALQRSHLIDWFLLILFCYESHVIMDFFTVGRGVMLFWPFATNRYLSPLILFYGLHWSDGPTSWRHLWTLTSELLFACLMLFGISRLAPRPQNLTGG